VGKGEPVILVHGFAGNLDVWESLIADLSKDHVQNAYSRRPSVSHCWSHSA
jgi:pimeloyl-ACP methyl ester carboxylesterase